MIHKPWNEPASSDDESTLWKHLEADRAQNIEREALRYCPEFPFKPSVPQTWGKKVSFYKDYSLVRLASDAGSEDALPPIKSMVFMHRVIFALWMEFGRTFEQLNRIAPICLTKENVMDYVLLRFRIELPVIFGGSEGVGMSGGGLSEIVTALQDLPFGKNENNPRITRDNEKIDLKTAGLQDQFEGQ